ncbi:DUF4886 domain-containing protein [Cerasicoccus fimbriatus]|uniref:DUF4886 domain-containing protein n=1 Tax=Cerasicoccus fimbriatus TaxID=3014554 RepID=UPI0022B4FF01|nr:DUF4886 domain-containing protein [Cerasicoccus sp. TK19100]
MKAITLVKILTFVLLFATGLSADTEKVKILGIGNSFTFNAVKYLDDICESTPGVDADVAVAGIGGCPLDKHVNLAKEHEADPEKGKKYDYQLNSKKVKSGASLKEILLAEEWDYITIQQVSTKSYKEETFYPYAKELIDYVRKYRPEAEIVIHETWSHSVNSYRAKDWKLDPDEMYTKLHANYAKIGAEYGLRIIPVGTSFQNARATEMWNLQPDGFDPKNHSLTYPEDKDNLPNSPKSLNSDYSWKKKKDGEWYIGSDGFHANTAGEYLGALVWFEFFTGHDANSVTYKPKSLSEAQAASLREVAHETLVAESES